MLKSKLKTASARPVTANIAQGCSAQSKIVAAIAKLRAASELPTAPPNGAAGPPANGNVDGGNAFSNYGGLDLIIGGNATSF